MAKASEPIPALVPDLDTLISTLGGARDAAPRARPPIDLWDPPFCGDIDMQIRRDGTWFYGGTPIGRPALVKLFASVLRKEADRYLLVTPVEKVGIVVEDAPFLAVEMARHGAVIALRTSVGDWAEVGEAHPLRFEPGPSGGLKPYVLMRGALWALVGRALFYELMDQGEIRSHDGHETFGIASGESFFPIMPADELEHRPQGSS